ncbi:hypothetical protein [Bacteroides ihuae]|uniref:hypothetical protein n=1 Tax=Bacteroides ihuae TaxID=1852362 RepID=UPI0008DB0A8D|nr:hypothetical protein [Bacteroides ihuae]
MKKIYTTSKYKRYHKRYCLKQQHRKKHKKYVSPLINKKKNNLFHQVTAPIDFRFLDNIEACAKFFSDLRKEDAIWEKNGRKNVFINIRKIEKIDFSTAFILSAISDEFKDNQIILRGSFPENEECLKYLSDSGFFNEKYDKNGTKFSNTEKTEIMIFEKGCGILSIEHMKKISDTVEHISNHLVNEKRPNLDLKSMLKEICGNSIEWSYAFNQQWSLGIKYEDDRIIFVAIDLGRGILDSLYRKFQKKLADIFTLKSDIDILMGAFDKKYGSSSKEINRNKGLPGIKSSFNAGLIKKLVAVTNNVMLDFENPERCIKFASSRRTFKGTLYKWEMDAECLNKRVL